MPAGSHLSARTTYPSTMPLFTALVYNYKDKLKTYHKIKATVYVHGSAEWSKVRLSQPIMRPSIPPSQDVFTYIGMFKWQFHGQRQPEPPLDYQLKYKGQAIPRDKQAPSGWFFTSGDYYSWFQIPESIITIERKRELQAMTEHLQDYKQYAHRNYRQDRASTSTTNLPWAMKRANELWKAIDEEREEMTTKRMKASKAGGA